MKSLLVLMVFFFYSCDQKREMQSAKSIVVSETEVEKVIRTSQPFCRSQFNCIKPVTVVGSSVKAIEINVHGTDKVSFTTYGGDGKPVDLGPNFLIEVKATKQPASIDANIVPKK